ncbi:MAG: hypothetical protein GC129_04495 [Proteobacteria bacterium]|nr:hypothetical protein [Pseudomonadota bacterium]
MVWTLRYPRQKAAKSGSVVAIGNFDGVHAGHKAVLQAAKEGGTLRALPVVALTFEPHPRAVLMPEQKLLRLTPEDEKVRLLGQAGADGVAIVDFDLSVAAWLPAEFIERVLVGWLDAKMVVVGENFRFGYRASGDVATLRKDGRFEVASVGLVRDGGGVVSSGRLREEVIGN